VFLTRFVTVTEGVGLTFDAFLTLVSGDRVGLLSSKAISLAAGDTKDGLFTFPVPADVPAGETRFSVRIRGADFTDGDHLEFPME